MDNATEQLTSARAADWLAQHQPKRNSAEWHQWLTNNRNAARSATVRVPFAKIGRTVWYRLSDLQRLAAHEDMVTRGFAPETANMLASADAGLLNQRWRDQGRFYGQYDDKAREPFVNLAIDQPLQTFRLSLEDAARLFTQLEGAIVNAESIASERNPEYQRKLKPRT